MTARHQHTVAAVVGKFDPEGANRYFLFGSSVRGDTFRDIDLGVVGNERSGKQLSTLRDLFYDAPIPYKVDVVDFDLADKEFTDHVLQSEPLVWI